MEALCGWDPDQGELLKGLRVVGGVGFFVGPKVFFPTFPGGNGQGITPKGEMGRGKPPREGGGGVRGFSPLTN